MFGFLLNHLLHYYMSCCWFRFLWPLATPICSSCQGKCPCPVLMACLPLASNPHPHSMAHMAIAEDPQMLFLVSRAESGSRLWWSSALEDCTIYCLPLRHEWFSEFWSHRSLKYANEPQTEHWMYLGGHQHSENQGFPMHCDIFWEAHYNMRL